MSKKSNRINIPEARDAMDEHWQEIEENWIGCEPVGYEIYEG